MTNRHMKKCSISSDITRGMQIKATRRYHFTLTKMTIIRKEGKEEGDSEH